MLHKCRVDCYTVGYVAETRQPQSPDDGKEYANLPSHPGTISGKSDDEEKIQVGTTNDDGTNGGGTFGQPGEQPAQDRTRNDDGSDSEVPCKESGEDEAQDGTTNDGDYDGKVDIVYYDQNNGVNLKIN